MTSSSVILGCCVRFGQSRHPVAWSDALRKMSLSRTLVAMLISLLVFSASAQNEAAPIFQPEPRPLPASVEVIDGLQLETYFTSLTQGGVGLLRLSGEGIVGARADFRHKDIPFFYIAGDAWYALIVANVDSAPGSHQLLVHARRDSGDTIFQRRVPVTPGNFIVQHFELTGGAAATVSKASERNAVASILSVIEDYIDEPLWDAQGFELPLDSPLTSPFGTFRLLNGDFETRHMGWDQNAAEGTPIRAMAAGIVARASKIVSDLYGVYGRFVMIDHGYKLFTNYAHLSETLVERGQRVEAGQIIALSGNTGRSSAPHLHWEVLAQGEWVDGLTLLGLWLPAPSEVKAESNAGQ